MDIITSSKFAKNLRKLSKRNKSLPRKVDKTTKLLAVDRGYSGLKLHKLSNTTEDTWSVSVTDDVRITFSYTSEGLLLLKIGGHDDVY